MMLDYHIWGIPSKTKYLILCQSNQISLYCHYKITSPIEYSRRSNHSMLWKLICQSKNISQTHEEEISHIEQLMNYIDRVKNDH